MHYNTPEAGGRPPTSRKRHQTSINSLSPEPKRQRSDQYSRRHIDRYVSIRPDGSDWQDRSRISDRHYSRGNESNGYSVDAWASSALSSPPNGPRSLIHNAPTGPRADPDTLLPNDRRHPHIYMTAEDGKTRQAIPFSPKWVIHVKNMLKAAAIVVKKVALDLSGCVITFESAQLGRDELDKALRRLQGERLFGVYPLRVKVYGLVAEEPYNRNHYEADTTSKQVTSTLPDHRQDTGLSVTNNLQNERSGPDSEKRIWRPLIPEPETGNPEDGGTSKDRERLENQERTDDAPSEISRTFPKSGKHCAGCKDIVSGEPIECSNCRMFFHQTCTSFPKDQDPSTFRCNVCILRDATAAAIVQPATSTPRGQGKIKDDASARDYQPRLEGSGELSEQVDQQAFAVSQSSNTSGRLVSIPLMTETPPTTPPFLQPSMGRISGKESTQHQYSMPSNIQQDSSISISSPPLLNRSISAPRSSSTVERQPTTSTMEKWAQNVKKMLGVVEKIRSNRNMMAMIDPLTYAIEENTTPPKKSQDRPRQTVTLAGPSRPPSVLTTSGLPYESEGNDQQKLPQKSTEPLASTVKEMPSLRSSFPLNPRRKGSSSTVGKISWTEGILLALREAPSTGWTRSEVGVWLKANIPSLMQRSSADSSLGAVLGQRGDAAGWSRLVPVAAEKSKSPRFKLRWSLNKYDWNLLERKMKRVKSIKSASSLGGLKLDEIATVNEDQSPESPNLSPTEPLMTSVNPTEPLTTSVNPTEPPKPTTAVEEDPDFSFSDLPKDDDDYALANRFRHYIQDDAGCNDFSATLPFPSAGLSASAASNPTSRKQKGSSRLFGGHDFPERRRKTSSLSTRMAESTEVFDLHELFGSPDNPSLSIAIRDALTRRGAAER
jgi:hypothetical protein